MWSGSKKGSYLRLIDLCITVSLNSRLGSNTEEAEVVGEERTGVLSAFFWGVVLPFSPPPCFCHHHHHHH